MAVLELCKDITDQKQTEDEMKLLHIQQQAIMDNIPDLAWLKDKESRFIAVNQSLGKACGMEPEKVEGLTDSDIWPEGLALKYLLDDINRYSRQGIIGPRFEEPLADKRE